MFGLCSLVIVACRITAVMPAPTTYDQKQTGELNVQIELKDVSVVALLNTQLLEDYTDYDYFYDYADFTIKPSGRPTTSPATGITERYDITEVSASPSQSSTISASPDDTANSTINEGTSSLNPSNDTASNSQSTSADDDVDKSQSSEDDGSGPAVVASPTTASSYTVAKAAGASRSRKRCRSGYVPGGNGRCRRANRRWLSLLP